MSDLFHVWREEPIPPKISIDTYIKLQVEAGISQKSIHGHWDIYDAKERIDKILDLNGVKVEQL